MEERGRSIIFLLGPISCGILQNMNSKSGFIRALKRDSFHIFKLTFIMNVRQDTPPFPGIVQRTKMLRCLQLVVLEKERVMSH